MKPNPTQPNNVLHDTLESLSAKWLEAKEYEQQAIEYRRSLEEQMTAALGIDEAFEGSKTLHEGGYKVVVKRSMTRKVDGDRLQEIAAEHGLEDYLSTLFRWKPDIDTKAWKAADEGVTKVLSGAITTTPGKPAYTVTKEEAA